MSKKNTIFGVKKSVLNIFHRIMLMAILHSSLIAPSQNMLIGYINLKRKVSVAQIPYNYTSSKKSLFKKDNENTVPIISNNFVTDRKKQSVIFNESAPLDYVMPSDIGMGYIGVSKDKPLDDAGDNIFKVYVESMPSDNSKVYLTYELFGAQDYTAVSRSFNNRFSTGGYIVKNQMGWTSQKEEINSKWLQLGENKITFGIPKGANYQYQIKNLKIEVVREQSEVLSSALVVHNPTIKYCKDNQIYLKGFLRKEVTDVKILFEDQIVIPVNGEFEGFLTLTETLKKRGFIVVKALDSKGLLGQEIINIDNLIEADKQFAIDKITDRVSSYFNAFKVSELKADGVSLHLKDSSLVVDKEISITKLRAIDIAPMNSGMINVTKGGLAYRFLPDGTKFNQPVSISLGYDEKLLPKGYSVNDIRTFYFNTNSKSWVAVQRDSINKESKEIVSLTTHFTDYINGIIQTPESPETAGFTPTMMNDIKAADPSSEMTIISPPEVSQTGEANISYPIKIPAGRKGMQPQLAVQYSNDGGNSWLGQGWNITVPAIAIDTRWGVPILDPDKETEIYTLNGEQLMYPKLNGFDWMPNRHHDTSETSTIYSTLDRPRISSEKALFTPRKQGSFAKIERLGNSVDEYYWKVTATDGTVSWYGGKDGVNENTIIRNDKGRIVYWGLYYVEDVHGNCIKYEYYNQVLSNQIGINENLNSGKVFHIENIYYNGYKDDNYKYQVDFRLKKNLLREDITINARLGLKQIEPYFLESIVVRKYKSIEYIRSYDFKTAYGKFGKGRLSSITELDKDGKRFHTHEFDYYDDIYEEKEEKDVYFNTGIEVNICNTDNPCLDTDGDGVCDDIDKCVDEPGPASNEGCPEPCLDTDGDGVCNSEDLCPNVAGPVSNNGCPADCGQQTPSNGQAGTYTYTVNVGTITGNITLNYNAQNVPDKFEISWNGGTATNGGAYANSGFVGISQSGSTNYYQMLVNIGVLPGDINLGIPSTGLGSIIINKTLPQPETVQVTVTAPFSSTAWSFNVACSGGSGRLSNEAAMPEEKLSSYILDFPIPKDNTISKIKINDIPLNPYSKPYDLRKDQVLEEGNYSLKDFVSTLENVFGCEVSVKDSSIEIKALKTYIKFDEIYFEYSDGTSDIYHFQEIGSEKLDKINTSSFNPKQLNNKEKKGSVDYGKYFRNMEDTYTYSFQSTVPINNDPNCPSFLNYDLSFQDVIPSFDSTLGVLGTSVTKADNVGFYVGVGIGCKWYTKSTTFGAQWTWSKDKSNARISLVDINGDGLDDIVFHEYDGFLYYKAHEIERTYDEYNRPIITHSFGPRKPITGINNFYKAYGSAKARNFQITFGVKKIGGFIGKDKSSSDSTNNVYFTDGNGDGLLDIVKNGIVYFNRLDSNNNPFFHPESEETENMVIIAEKANVEVPEEEDDFETPNYDVVKVWEAPADGIIKIDNTIVNTDTSKEAVVTIEKKSAENTECFSTTFNVPQNVLNLYRYFQTITMVQLSSDPFNAGLTNQSCTSYNATQNYYRSIHRVTHLNTSGVGEQFAPLSAARNVYMVNGSASGFQNLCNSVLNPDFEQDARNYIEGTTFPSENIHFYSTDIQNLSFTYLDSNNNFRISAGFNADLFSNWLPSNIYMQNPQVGVRFRISMWSKTWDNLYSNPNDASAISHYNNYNLFSTNPIQAITPVEVNVFVNGTPMVGNPYNILEQFSNFKSNFETQYQGTTVTLNTTTNPNNVIINSSNPSISTIALVNNEDNQSQTFSFAPCSLLKSIENNIVNKWNKVNPKLEKQATELAINAWLSKGNELNLPYPEIALTQNVNLPYNEGKKKEEYYHFIKQNDELQWFNVRGEVIKDKKILDILKNKTPSDLEEIYEQVKEKSITYLIEYRNEKQLIAQQWLDEYYKKQSEKNTQIVTNESLRSINPSTCNETSDELCLLYGTTLNASNTNITNTLVNNCSGQPLSVKKGERIYFRVHAGANGSPKIDWNPKITYTAGVDASALDQNALKIYESSYNDGFILSDNKPTPFPGNKGKATISWETITVDNPSDDIVYEIYHRKTIAQENNDNDTVTGDTVPIYSFTCPANQLSQVSSAGVLSILDIPVLIDGNEVNLTLDDFYFKVTSTSNVNWKQYEWKPKIACVVETQIIGEGNVTEGTLTSNETIYPIVDYSIYKYYSCSSGYSLFDTGQVNGGIGLSIKPNLSGVFASGDTGKLNFVVKSNGILIGKRIATINNGAVNLDNNTPITLLSSGQNIEIGYYIDDSNLYDTEDSLLSKLVFTANPIVKVYYNGTSNSFNVSKDKINLYQKPNPKFGPMLRQWGQFLYNPNAVTDAVSAAPYGNLIKESTLFYDLSLANNINNAVSNLNENSIDENSIDQIEEDYNDLFNTAFLIASPSKFLSSDNVIQERWIGMHDENYASEFSYRAATMGQSFDSSYDVEPYDYQSILETGAYSINKINRGKNKNFSGGASIDIGASVGANASKTLSGDNKAVTDYIDFNGDRYPDLVTSKQVQYTKRIGGLFPPSNREGDINISQSSSWGVGAQGSYSKGGDSSDTPKGYPKLHVSFEGFKGSAGGGLSINFSKGKSVSNRVWTDINGDGLADLLEKDSNGQVSVGLNYGYSMDVENYSWNLNNLFNSRSTNIAGGGGVNKWNGSFEAGVAVTSAWNDSTEKLVDMNGDGLLDYVSSDDDINVRINRGNRFFSLEQTWSERNFNRESVSLGFNANATLTAALVWYIPFTTICLKIPAVSVSKSLWSTTTSKTKKTITDFDGDGYPDIVEQITNNSVRVYSSKIRRTDMLKSVKNPLGGIFEIDYKVQKVDYNNPHPKWVMSDVKIYDGYNKVNDSVDIYYKRFIYENGRYDRRERAFYGYETVKVQDYTVSNDGELLPVYRTTVSKYYNNSYFLKGLLRETYIMKGEDENMKFSRTQNFYEIRKLNVDNSEMTFTVLPDNFDVGGKEGRKSAGVLMTKTKNYYYELAPSPLLETEIVMDYDAKGRVARYENKGNINDSSDDYISKIKYHDDSALIAKNIISIPASIEVYNDVGQLKRLRSTDVDVANGNIVKLYTLIDEATSLMAQTSMKYDQYGNLVYIEYPQNENGQAMSYTYKYDAAYNKYIVSITDAFGYFSSATYDSSFDKVLQTIDLAGNKMIYEYDNFGRTIKVIAPKEQQSGTANSYTIRFNYYHNYASLNETLASCVKPKEFVPFAMTAHYDQAHAPNDIQTITFIDGLARPIQVKKDIYINEGMPQAPQSYERMSVSGKIAYDAYGRAVQQFHPSYEKKGCSSYNVNEYEADYFSTTEYDELDRPIRTIDPEGNESSVKYSIDTDNFGAMAMKTQSTVDQNGSQSIITETYKDVNGRVISTNNIGDNELWTKFEYNSIGELMSYTDAENIVTKYVYDIAGRKVVLDHPDNGTTSFKYDDAGNLIKLQTANLANNTNLDPEDRFIKYHYDYNRLKGIEYPKNPDSSPNIANVVYEYGGSGSGNETGRLILQTDASGYQAFKYGSMGEMIYNERTVVGPNIPTRTFITEFEYDSWNRLHKMIYPDGEKVSFYYDLGGNLTKMTGSVNDSPYDYISRIDYDHFEQRTYLVYGNKTETFYSYTPSLRRMDNLNVKTATGADLFNNNYSYDKVGNITKLSNSAASTPNHMAGSYGHTFEYDKFNRLFAANGEFTGSPAQQEFGNDYISNYDLELKYNATHGIIQKSQKHVKNGNGYDPNSYSNEYGYYEGTHKIKGINDGWSGLSEDFEYDLNGNLVKKTDNLGNARRVLWDESNRLRVVNDNNSMQHYIYDAGGERVLKANTDVENVFENGTLTNNIVTINGYTSYPSAYIVINQAGVYTKHYYAGSQRIVSRLGEEAGMFGFSPRMSNPNSDFDEKKLKQLQLADVKQLAEKVDRKKVVFREYKPFTYEEIEQKLKEEDDDKPKEMQQRAPEMAPLYFYHPDHLGTSTALTDFNGEAYQFFLNLPFGETMVEQLGNNYFSTPYKFNGKELDEETGLYYYGARYYDPRVSVWYSVDPLMEKMPNWSPYSYAFNNPVRYVDEDGRIPIIPWLLKAGAAAAADMLAQASMDYLFNSSTTSWGQAFDNVNWWQVGRSGAEGLIPWRTPGGKIGRAALTASGDVLVNALNNPDSYTAEQAGLDFVTGFIGDLAGGGFGQIINKYGSKAVINGLMDKMSYSATQIRKMTGGFDGDSVRKWYKSKVDAIDINVSPTEANARSIVDKRNLFKQQARDLMSNQNAAKNLPAIESYDFYYNKSYNKGLRGEALYQDIINGGKKTNATYNKKYGE